MSNRAQRRRTARQEAAGETRTAAQMLVDLKATHKKQVAMIEGMIRKARLTEADIAAARALVAGEETHTVPPPSAALMQAIADALGPDYARVRTGDD